jgi:Spy/CpxP family protein refolding chaperone
MKKLAIAALAIIIPLALFAQGTPPASKPGDQRADRQVELLKSFKLSDAQIAQVGDIEKATRTTIESDFAKLRLFDSQIRVDLLPATGSPDLAAINKLIDQKSQLRGEMEKTLVAARVQLVQIMGNDNFRKFFRELRERGPRGMMGQGGPMMGRDSPRGDRMGHGERWLDEGAEGHEGLAW